MTSVDQLGRKFTFDRHPQRIISLVPSQTELLFSFGLDAEVAGITKFCVHPGAWFRTKTRVGGTKKQNFETIALLQPDLIIANKEENDRGSLEILMKKYPVWISDIKNLDDSFQMILSLGELTGKQLKAQEIVSGIRSGFENLEKTKPAPVPGIYLIWNDPIMLAGQDTFINDMMQRCGISNCSPASESRYPEMTIEKISELDPALILLSSEPFPFKEKHREEIQKLFTNSKVLLADGEMFSWYGSRLLKAPEYFGQMIKLF